MRRIFLGPVWHWIFALLLVGAGWYAGSGRFHVISFNSFAIALIAATTAVIVLVIATSPRGRQVTRDPIADEDDD